jgi:hypothetical protein
VQGSPPDKETRDATGVDEHCLWKMPEHTRPWRYREKAVKYLKKALTAFQNAVDDK